jgi:drug/metabolite transporter (DMT)-like permease
MTLHAKAVLQALFVVFLWATSWILIKIGIKDIPPIIFAGLRYFIAFIGLLILIFVNGIQNEIREMPKSIRGQLTILGILFYAGTQGAIFVALAYLPAVTVNLLWSFSSIVVAIFGIFWLAENPTWSQWGGILIATIGAIIYFIPLSFPQQQLFGVAVAGIGVLANAVSSIMGRSINRSGKYHPLVVTVITMGTGSIILLLAGIIVEGLPDINLQSWAIILWLALVNTAFAFTLWNHTLRTLTAMESSIINGTMMVWIPIFAILFLRETITGKEIVGLIIVGAGTIIVQLKKKKSIVIRHGPERH